MKKAFKVFLVGFVAIVLVTVVVGALLPSEWEAEASVEINATPAQIHSHVSSFKAWEGWATEAMQREDPTAVVTLSGPDAGVGATMAWQGDKMGRGRLTITESDPATGIKYEAAIESDDVNSHGSISFETTKDGTRVTWHDEGDLPPIIGGLLSAQVNQALSEHFEQSLTKLKEALETPAEAPAAE